jgi:hypothetical protein
MERKISENTTAEAASCSFILTAHVHSKLSIMTEGLAACTLHVLLEDNAHWLLGST